MGRSFRILGTLGRGAFGEVHLTEIRTDDDFVQTLAVKWLHPEFSDDDELARRLRDEARLLGLLDHPNVVRVQGLTRLDGRLAVLMEAVRGRDLAGSKLPARAACQVGAAVAEALDAAWNMVPPGRDEPLRVVHRDIKPSNVMVTPRGLVKVMDFGVARATFEAREAQTRSQQYGTARYMAPERWLEGVAEGPSDVFSLGVTLVELVTGEPVARPRLSRQGFAEDVESVLATVEPPHLREQLARMLAFAPEERPDAPEVARTLASLDVPGQDLRTWAATLEIDAPRATEKTGTVVVEHTGDTIALTGTVESVPAALPPVPTELPEAPPVSSPLPRVLGLAAVAGLLLLLGYAWLASPGPSEPALPTPSPSLTPPALPASVQPAPPERPSPDPAPVAPAPQEPPRPEVTPRPSNPAPTPVPAPAPVATTPAPTAVRPAPPEPAEPPDVVEEAPKIPIRFLIAAGVTASTSFGALPTNGAAMLPRNRTVRVEGVAPTGAFGCTLPIGNASSTWSIGADGTCRERH